MRRVLIMSGDIATSRLFLIALIRRLELVLLRQTCDNTTAKRV
ncbi:MAG TPA: hypothetical protein VJM50_05900 [Pyrinomonadaceae bacterium]|nr:hypothetical protein [Pyrinomonadaceae bacterium]